MITVEVWLTAERCEVAVDGHAGFASVGQDIYCAGVSSLICTLGLHPGVTGEYDHGYARIAAEPTAANLLVFRTIARGLKGMAEQYPLFVTYIENDKPFVWWYNQK